VTGPDDCPWHEVATLTPGKTVLLYDEDGRYLGPASAELACAGWHVGTWIDRVCANLLDLVEQTPIY
jgi:hypothetical protein